METAERPLASVVMQDASFWKNRRVLVTGHTGFKGCWLLLWLQQLGAEVWGYSLPPEKEPNLFRSLLSDISAGYRCKERYADLSDIFALKDWVQLAQPQVVFHLAAQALVRPSYDDPLGTWSTNVQGSLHILEALKPLDHLCTVVMITTDKVYENREWTYGYRETDRLGGHDPYSASKAAAELAISSWRMSFCGADSHQTSKLRIATARAGNVIGGGDWATDRIVPDAMRALAKRDPIIMRNPLATRPWQHVLEPLAGYLRLAEVLSKESNPPCEPFNFGPHLDSNRTVYDLVESILSYWKGISIDTSDNDAPHEANSLHLQIDKAYHYLDWRPIWDFETSIQRTVNWYKSVHNGAVPLKCCLEDLHAYQTTLHE